MCAMTRRLLDVLGVSITVVLAACDTTPTATDNI